MQLIPTIRNGIRVCMRQVARLVQRLSGGRVSPDAVTVVGCVMHVPIAMLIAVQHNWWAAGLLVVFGLFDTLDGELARLQGRASARGMLLDASTDRIKEVLLYVGVAYALAGGSHPRHAVWAAAACGASLCVSYIKAKGEAAMASRRNIPHAKLNRLFADGLLTFEVRMVVLIAGLAAGQLLWAVGLIATGAGLTALQRLIKIMRQL